MRTGNEHMGVRVFREKPFGWWDKPTMRYLRGKYGLDKKTFCALRSVYLALCEIDSDFEGTPINSFTKTVGTYAGTSRQVAGKYIRLLEEENLIRQTRLRDPHTQAFKRGTLVEILSIRPVGIDSDPLAGYPASGESHRRYSRPTIKKISNNKKISINTNVVDKINSEEVARAEYYADLIAKMLGDQSSFSFYRAVCMRNDGAILLKKATEIVRDGGARKPAAVFTAWFKSRSSKPHGQSRNNH